MFQSFCSDLIIRTDHGHNSHVDHKSISSVECKAKKERRKCTKRGCCIVAFSESGMRVNSKTDLCDLA